MDVHSVSEETIALLDYYILQEKDNPQSDIFGMLDNRRYYDIGRNVDTSIKGDWHRTIGGSFDETTNATKYFVALGQEAVAGRNHWIVAHLEPTEEMNLRVAKVFQHVMQGCDKKSDSSSHAFVDSFLYEEYRDGRRILPSSNCNCPENLQWARIEREGRKLASLLLVQRPEKWMLQVMDNIHGQGAAAKDLVGPTRELIKSLDEIRVLKQLLPFFTEDSTELPGEVLTIWLELDNLFNQMVREQHLVGYEDFVRSASVTLAGLCRAELTPMRVSLAIQQELRDDWREKDENRQARDWLTTDVALDLVLDLDSRWIHKPQLYQFVYDIVVMLEEKYKFSPAIADSQTRDQVISGVFRLVRDGIRVQWTNSSITDEALISGLIAFIEHEEVNTTGITPLLCGLRSQYLQRSLVETLDPYIMDALKAIEDADFERQHPEINPGRILERALLDPLAVMSGIIQAVAKAIVITESDKKKIKIHLDRATNDLKPLFSGDDALRQAIGKQLHDILEAVLIIDLSQLLSGQGQELISGLLADYGKQAAALADYLTRHSFKVSELPLNMQRMGLLAEHFIAMAITLRNTSSEGVKALGFDEVQSVRSALKTAEKIIRYTPQLILKILTQLTPAIADVFYNLICAVIRDPNVRRVLKYMDEDLIKGAALLLDDVIDRHRFKQFLPIVVEFEKILDPKQAINKTELARAFAQAAAELLQQASQSGLFEDLLAQIVHALKVLSTPFEEEEA